MHRIVISPTSKVYEHTGFILIYVDSKVLKTSKSHGSVGSEVKIDLAIASDARGGVSAILRSEVFYTEMILRFTYKRYERHTEGTL